MCKINSFLYLYLCAGKLALLDLGNNSITAKGAFYVAEYIKRSKSLVWLNLYMNDIGDEVYYYNIQIDNHVFCILGYVCILMIFQWVQGAKKVADALKQNRSIATIDIVRSDIFFSSLSKSICEC